MASALKVGLYSKLTLACCCSALLFACGDSAPVVQEQLSLPEREESVYITDQVYVAGRSLSLWNQDGGCQLQVSNSSGQNANTSTQWIKPMAPCFFIRSPGSDKLQVFQQDKATRIVAVLGTTVQQNSTKRCGREVQGLLINSRGKVSISDRILSGSIYCAESGLDNFQYSLFHGS